MICTGLLLKVNRKGEEGQLGGDLKVFIANLRRYFFGDAVPPWDVEAEFGTDKEGGEKHFPHFSVSYIYMFCFYLIKIICEVCVVKLSANCRPIDDWFL